MTARFRMEKTEKKTVQHKVRPPIFQLTNRFLLFTSLFVLVSIVFYITGSINSFLDSSLLFILGILQVASVITIVFCLCSLIQIIFFTIYYKDLSFLWHLIHVMLSFVLAILGFVFSGVVNVLAAGM
ncbi:MAG: hypothetical protein IKA80_09670 [Spirochaetaceae bacterium]|nr:hypothetical protein [Spirochaetaceae bacterium]MBR2362895.1 hypothetical protein [Spirochaetaceae bacterium]